MEDLPLFRKAIEAETGQRVAKKCPQCGQMKPLDLFVIAKRGIDGHSAWCKVCHNTHNLKRYYRKTGRKIGDPKIKHGPKRKRIFVTEKRCNQCEKTLPTADFGSHNQTIDGFNSTCKACCRERTRLWNIENRAYMLATHKTHHDKLTRGLKDEKVIKAKLKKYDITRLHYNTLYEVFTECPLCGSSVEFLRIDHDHLNDEVRGLLCHDCNTRLGPFDNPAWLKKAYMYLAHWLPGQIEVDVRRRAAGDRGRR